MLGNIVKRFEWPLVREAQYKCSPYTIYQMRASCPCWPLASCVRTRTPHYHSVTQLMLLSEPLKVDSYSGHLSSRFGSGIMPGSHSNFLPPNQGIINSLLLHRTHCLVSRPRVVETQRIPLAPEKGLPRHPRPSVSGHRRLWIIDEATCHFMETRKESRRSVPQCVRRYVSHSQPFYLQLWQTQKWYSFSGTAFSQWICYELTRSSHAMLHCSVLIHAGTGTVLHIIVNEVTYMKWENITLYPHVITKRWLKVLKQRPVLNVYVRGDGKGSHTRKAEQWGL